jgi:hypothetical protein
MMPWAALTSSSVPPMSNIEWFWAIVCNAIVIGGIVVPGLLFGLWWVTGPHGDHRPSYVKGTEN